MGCFHSFLIVNEHIFAAWDAPSNGLLGALNNKMFADKTIKIQDHVCTKCGTHQNVWLRRSYDINYLGDFKAPYNDKYTMQNGMLVKNA